MSPSPHLHPMRPDGLAPRPAPQAAASREAAALAPAQPKAEEPSLRPASFVPAPQEEEFSLLGDFILTEEDDEPDDLPDAMPSEQMPSPACVPLFELPQDKPIRLIHWIWPLVLAAAAGALAAVIFRMMK